MAAASEAVEVRRLYGSHNHVQCCLMPVPSWQAVKVRLAGIQTNWLVNAMNNICPLWVGLTAGQLIYAMSAVCPTGMQLAASHGPLRTVT